MTTPTRARAVIGADDMTAVMGNRMQHVPGDEVASIVAPIDFLQVYCLIMLLSF